MAVHPCKLDQHTLRCTGRDTLYAGAVLGTWERNGYDDSDFLAAVWDANTGQIITHFDWSTSASVCHAGVEVDATEQVRVAARQWLVERYTQIFIARNTVPRPGVRARSLTTRGKAKGLEGTITAERPSRYDRGATVFLLEGATGSAWVAPERLEVTEEVDEYEMRTEAALGVHFNATLQDLTTHYTRTLRLAKEYGL